MTGVQIPTSPDELEAMLGDSTRMRDVLKDQVAFAEFIKNYAGSVMAKDENIAVQVREQTQKVLAEWLKDHKGPDTGRIDLSAVANGPLVASAVPPRFGLYNKGALGAKLDSDPVLKGATLANYFQTIWHKAEVDQEISNRRRSLRNAFGSEVPSDGGFLIPETLRSDLLRVSLETAIVRPRARIVPMETLRVPYPAVDSTSNVSSVYGGIVAAWTEEGGSLSETQAKFSRVVLEAKKLTAYTEVPNELLSDSISSFTQFISEIFPEALSFYEDDAFLNGTGVGQPRGVLNADCAVAIDRATSNLITFADVVAMFCRMLPSSLGRAVWVASIDTLPQLLQLVMATGGTTDFVSPPLWLNGQQAIQAPAMTLLGRPIIFTEKAPKLGSKGDLNLIDFGFYLIGDRQAMSAQSSPHYKFQDDVTSFRIIQRVDGRPWLASAITPKNNSASLSPVVTLDVHS